MLALYRNFNIIEVGWQENRQSRTQQKQWPVLQVT